jgi:hypothetical protein
LPPADDDMVRQILDAGRGAPAEQIAKTLRDLFQRGRFREIRSWGLVPRILKSWFAPFTASERKARQT